MATPNLQPGQLALVRQRRYLVERVEPPPVADQATLVSLSCVESDAQGESLTVLWDHELDAQILSGENWSDFKDRKFDDPETFAAYLRTMSWNCVTATDPNLYQSPFRAGIHYDAYQLAPLDRALKLPRVNLFIADDVGLGKTIEAGLIARELLLRRRVDRIVVACPATMRDQWHEEMESRFGLYFQILDREYLAAMRRERGFSVNPWTTHSRFIVSHNLLIDETYAAGLRDWLGELAPQSLLILDEAHNAAPSHGSSYAIDSQTTRSIRDLAPRFEHRLFLSATPHNGHSNSFSALLEILDAQRFCRGVKVRKSDLDQVLVRRLKSDIRAYVGGFPKRNIVRIEIDDLPPDAPELVLAEKLDQYRRMREERLQHGSKSEMNAGALVIGGLQKRLLSGIEAFARTLAVHRKSVERALEKELVAPTLSGSTETELERLTAGKALEIGDETLDQEAETEGEVDVSDNVEGVDPVEQDHDDLMTTATSASSDSSQIDLRSALQQELRFVGEMQDIAEEGRYGPDPRVDKLVEWIDTNMCPGVRNPRATPPRWNETRLLIFTEYGATRKWLEDCLTAAIAHTHRAPERIASYTGNTSRQKREDIKHAFNAEPNDYPVRILVATDAAREGLNLQRHCHNLFHFDLPWNPGRLDQRNGRIDRKLQPSDEVFCHYFVFKQRPVDRVLEVLVRKVETIREELGSAANVLEERIAEQFKSEGIRDKNVVEIAREIEFMARDKRSDVVQEELERSRVKALGDEVRPLLKRLERSREHIGITPEQFQQTLSRSLRVIGVEEIEELDGGASTAKGAPKQFEFPTKDGVLKGDPSWVTALDTLRTRRQARQTLGEWRRDAEIRPVVFDDSGPLGENAVHLHLEHRVAARLLSRFSAQGMLHHDLSKVCLTLTNESVPRVILLGRIALYGPGAARLHEEIIPVAAAWQEPTSRDGPLSPYARTTEGDAIRGLQAALDTAGLKDVPAEVQRRLGEAAQSDVDDLLPHLEKRAKEHELQARQQLQKRADDESGSMHELLENQKKRISELAERDDRQQELDFDPAERRQREADRRAWQKRLLAIDEEFKSEPARIRATYEVQAVRLDLLGLVYLWPDVLLVA